MSMFNDAAITNSLMEQGIEKIEEQRRTIKGLREALEFYADPFAWKKKHDPENDIQVPDFYSETSFGDTATAALSAYR